MLRIGLDWKRTVLGCGKLDSVIAGASITKQLIGILVKSGFGSSL